MASARQRQAARANVKKARTAWRAMSSRARARAQPQGSGRAKPGATGRGAFFHIEVRPRREFKTFRTHDVGNKGGIERVAGKRGSGSWSTQKWLIGKNHAHIHNGKLIADSNDAKHVLDTLGTAPVHVSGNRFRAKDRPNVPERQKPTLAQRRAQGRNIKKAQAVRWKT
jgi:plasmid stabilization system protein ParE